MRDYDLLYLRPQFRLLDSRLALLPITIKPGAAYLSQPAHGLDPEVCLRLHHLDFFVDAVSPEPLLGWRRASILRNTPCKKSASSTLVASACFSCSFSRSKRFSRLLQTSAPSSKCLSKRRKSLRQLYNWRFGIPISSANFSCRQLDIRSTAWRFCSNVQRRYRLIHTPFVADRDILSCLSFGGHSNPIEVPRKIHLGSLATSCDVPSVRSHAGTNQIARFDLREGTNYW